MNERQPTRHELNRRRIAVATGGLALAAALATAAFAAAAAHATKASSHTASATGSSSSRDDSGDQGTTTLSPSQYEPQQSFGPAAAGSGGS